MPSGIIDLNHKSEYAPFQDTSPAARKKYDLAAAINSVLDEALVEAREREYAEGRGSGDGDVAKKRIGAAYIGMECDRALAYRYHRYPKEQRESIVSPGELHRHALSGFWTETSMAEWLRLAGFDIHTKKPDGSQYGYKVARDPISGKARIAGEIDGVILGVPKGIEIPVPAIWESKKSTAKKWTKFVKSGVRVADPQYFSQVQCNMAYLSTDHTLFSMLCLDNMKVYWELIKFDPEVAQKVSDRAVRVLNSREPKDMPRIAAKEDFFVCRYCEYHNSCWTSDK